MRRPQPLRFLLVVALAVIPTPAAMASVIVTGPLDQAGFQALLAAASPGDTIKCLGGVYDFTAPGPVLLDKGLEIVAADPADPPIFRGDGTFGTPMNTGNNGFIQAEGSFIDGLTIQGLHFEDFDRTLAFPNSHDTSVPGCPLIPGAGAKDIAILDNTGRNTRRFVQLFGGLLEGFVVSGNDVELATDFGLGVYLVGTSGVLPECGVAELVRPVDGVVKENHVDGGRLSVVIDGARSVSVKNNILRNASFAGIFFADTKAWSGPDDGPIPLGSVKGNIIDSPFVGIVTGGPTTITRAEIKDNQVTAGFVNIYLQPGANGFDVKSNQFFGPASPNVFLDFYTYNNVVRVAPGDVVIDLGTNNTVKTSSGL